MRMRGLAALAFTLLAIGVLAGTAAAQPAKGASPGDNARFLAGLPVDGASPLSALTTDPGWQQHADFFNKEWAALDKRQMSKVRAFSAKHLTQPSKTLFYMFSGPDMLYAEAFFPKATTYVLVGLEPIGPIPDATKLKKGNVGQALSHLKTSLRHIVGFSYFITLDMGKHLAQGQFPGTLPILYVFLARADKTVRDVSYMKLDPDGKLTPLTEASPDPKQRPRAVKITFAGKDDVEQTLYYFSTDLSNGGVAQSGILKFCETLAPGDAFVKSASYLLHGGGFSSVRDFLLKHSQTILEDDTGIPLAFFREDQWKLLPHGKYTGPIAIFRGNYQPKLKALFDKGNPPPFEFSLGYRWRPGQSSLLQAVRK